MDQSSFFSAHALLAWATYFVGVASPGPSNMAIMSVAMGSGRRDALTFASGVSSGAFFWAVMATLGVSALIAAHPPLIFTIKIVGGLYFIWLGYKAARSAMRAGGPTSPTASGPPATRAWLYLRGLLMHLTNPKAILIWMSIVAMGANTPIASIAASPASLGTGMAQTYHVTVGCILIGITVFISYALLFSTSLACRAYTAARRWLDGGLAVMFLGAGISLLSARA